MGVPLRKTGKDVLLYHLRLLQKVKEIVNGDKAIEAYHVAILRQLLENISSFLGAGYFSHALIDLGYSKEEASKKAMQINTLTHQDLYSPHVEAFMSKDEIRDLLKEVYDRIVGKYSFITHSKQ